jgi:hypothetical protein
MSLKHGEEGRGHVDPDVSVFGPTPYFGLDERLSNHHDHITMSEIDSPAS